MRLSAQARSCFSPASAATATRASLTASPSRNGSTPSVTAFSAPTKVGEPAGAQEVDDGRRRPAGRPRWRASAASAAPPSRRCRPPPRSPPGSRRSGPACRAGRCPCAGRAGEHRQADRTLGEVEQQGRHRQPPAIGDADQEHDRGLQGHRHGVERHLDLGRGPEQQAAERRPATTARRALRPAPAGHRRSARVGVDGRREHGRSRRGRGRCWRPDHRDGRPAGKPRSRVAAASPGAGRAISSGAPPLPMLPMSRNGQP